MKTRELKEKIYEAYSSEKPDIRERILASCASEQTDADLSKEPEDAYPAHRRESFFIDFKRISAVAACLVIFGIGIFLGMLASNHQGNTVPSEAETFVYFDVNPSVELCMDGENRVVKCLAGNEDAETVLSGLKLEGVDMHTALTAIVGSMYVNGYLTEDSNSILISVETAEQEKVDSLISDIAAKINSVFEKSNTSSTIP